LPGIGSGRRSAESGKSRGPLSGANVGRSISRHSKNGQGENTGSNPASVFELVFPDRSFQNPQNCRGRAPRDLKLFVFFTPFLKFSDIFIFRVSYFLICFPKIKQNFRKLFIFRKKVADLGFSDFQIGQ
jgi:hypothetical protein